MNLSDLKARARAALLNDDGMSSETRTALLGFIGFGQSADDNQGLPCPHCGTKMKRLDLQQTSDGIAVRVNWEWTKAEAKKQAKGLASLIKSMVDRL